MQKIYTMFAFLCCTGCARIPPADDGCIATMVEDRIGKHVVWEQNCLSAEREISVDEAVQVALLNNPEIQAMFEEIGIAHADLVRAGLLSNPFIDGYVRFPNRQDAVINTEFSLSQNFIDLLLLPLRKKVAEVEYEQTELRVANAILNLAFEVEETYYRLEAELYKRKLMDPIVDLLEAASQLSFGQKSAGNINDIEYKTRKNEYLKATIEKSHMDLEIVRLQEKMNQLLATDRSSVSSQMNEEIHEISTNGLEELALNQRLDFQLAQREVERLAEMYGLQKWWAYTAATLGVSSERDPENITSTGPSFSFEIPLFNYGQADRERIQAMFYQSIDRLMGLEIAIRAEVRSAGERIAVLQNMVNRYKNDLLPLQREIVDRSQKYYNYMALNVYTLIDVKRQEFQMQIDYGIALRDYWIARVELDRALGGRYE